MADTFRDHRGVIEDILPHQIDCVTRIFTVAGGIRGNHTHEHTHQWTYIVSGSLKMIQMLDDGPHQVLARAGELVSEPPGVAHAWQAMEDTTVLVFTSGPRSGAAYESDTVRLAVPLLS